MYMNILTAATYLFPSEEFIEHFACSVSFVCQYTHIIYISPLTNMIFYIATERSIMHPQQNSNSVKSREMQIINKPRNRHSFIHFITLRLHIHITTCGANTI